MESNRIFTNPGITLSASKWVMPKISKPLVFLKGLTKVVYSYAYTKLGNKMS